MPALFVLCYFIQVSLSGVSSVISIRELCTHASYIYTQLVLSTDCTGAKTLSQAHINFNISRVSHELSQASILA